MRLGTGNEWQDWLWRGRYGWSMIVMLVLGAIWLSWCWPITRQDPLRQLGLFYQVVGVIAACWQLRKTAQEHGRPSLLRRTLAYLANTPLLRSRDVTVALTGQGMAASVGNVSAASGTVGTPSLEEKVDWLMRNAADTTKRINNTIARLDAEAKERNRVLQEERQQREGAVADLLNRIRASATGSLDLALWGLFYVLLGTLLSTATPELCRWLHDCVS